MKLFLVPFFVLAVLLCTGCNAAPVAADTAAVTTAAVTETVTLSESAILTDTAEISDILTEIVPENTAEPVPVETEPPAAQPDSEPSLPPPAQVHISFKGTPNRYEYMPCAIEVTDPAGAYAAISDSKLHRKPAMRNFTSTANIGGFTRSASRSMSVPQSWILIQREMSF